MRWEPCEVCGDPCSVTQGAVYHDECRMQWLMHQRAMWRRRTPPPLLPAPEPMPSPFALMGRPTYGGESECSGGLPTLGKRR